MAASRLNNHGALTVTAELHFLERSKEYDEVKPYSTRYLPKNGIPQSIIRNEKKMVEIRDIRKCQGTLDFKTCGFGVMPFKSRMEYAEFEDVGKIRGLFMEELRETLEEVFHARSVYIFDHVVRRRHPTFPISTGEEYEHEQPTSLAHIDHSHENALTLIKNIFGEETKRMLNMGWQLVNIWQPLKGPLNDWPLAVCDASSVEFDEDTMLGDIAFPTHLIENVHVHSNNTQRWYYISEQMPFESLVFRDVDCDENYGSPHAAFSVPGSSSSGMARESIDCRAFIFGGDLSPLFGYLGL